MRNTKKVATEPYIQSIMGWRFEFLFMLLYTLILQLIVTTVIPETNTYRKQRKKTVKIIIAEYYQMTIDPEFFINVLIASFIVSMIYIFYAITSFYLQDYYHWSAIEYSRITILLAAALFVGRKLNVWLSSRISNKQIIFLGSLFTLFASILMALFSWFHINVVITLLLPIAIYTTAGGAIFSNTFVGATANYTETAGSASSLYGFTQMLTVFALISISSLLRLSSVKAIYLLIFILSFISIIMIRYLITDKGEEK